MLGGLMLLLQVQSASGIVLNASVDRSRINVGEEVVLTIIGGGRTADQVELNLPDFSGFAVLSRSETSEVTLGVARARIVTVEIRLRAQKAGNYAFGPITVRQGGVEATIDGPDLEVTESAAAGMLALNPRVRDLVSRAPPPRLTGKVGLSVVLSRDTVLVGEQVDLLTAAWFPRDLRSQLRRQPVLQPPVLDGVWSFPQTSPPGIAASKRVGDKWYDLFVAHQVVFPLAAGPVKVPPATLRYSVPVATQFFSQEERFTVSSDPRTLTVSALPLAGQPAGFAGATGRDLKLERNLTPSRARAGEAVNVEIVVRGEGNVALWPAPELKWQPGARAYAEGSSEEMQSVAGRLTGAKRFRFVVVPSQSGVLTIPAVSYPYYDFGRRAYSVVALPPMGVAVGPAREASTARAMPPPLLTPRGAPLAEQVRAVIPPWGWALVLAMPPLAFVGLSWRRRTHHPKPPARRRSDVPELALDRALHRLLPREDVASTERLVPALRAAGLTDEAARSVAQLRDQLQGHRYGPPGRGDAPDQQALDAALARLREALSSRPVRMAVLCLLLASPAIAQRQLPAESLYAVGALSGAAQGFQAALKQSPDDPALWYNLGAARYRQGEDGAAAAAWLTALRLSPRNPTVRRALLLTPPPDQTSAGRRSVPPISASEMLLIAACCWLGAWGLIAWRRHSRLVPLLFLFAVVSLSGAVITRWWNQRPLGLVATDTPLRAAPHGRAAGIRTLPSGTALLIEKQQADWVLVRGSGDEQGWLPRASVAQVGE